MSRAELAQDVREYLALLTGENVEVELRPYFRPTKSRVIFQAEGGRIRLVGDDVEHRKVVGSLRDPLAPR